MTELRALSCSNARPRALFPLSCARIPLSIDANPAICGLHTSALRRRLNRVMFCYPRQVKLASKRFLAGSLGIAAGVMLYVSLVEIFVKSVDAFAAHGCSEVSGVSSPN